ncbi:MAG TPA: VOC family protein [Candidatus Limnocylindrales bacterium]|nr:VOC family protein [Candidatus Limnocylindrales bacterium]
MDLNHLYLVVRDVDRSVEFYRRFFGFDGPSEWQGETFVVHNDEGFALSLTPGDSPPPWPGELHFGFLLESVDEARSLRTLMESAGHRMVEAYEEPGFVVFKVLDPDGYLVEVEAGVPVSPPP